MLKKYFLLSLILWQYVVLNAQQAPFVNTASIVSSIPLEQESYAPFRYGDKLYLTSQLPAKGQPRGVFRLFSVDYGKSGMTLMDVNPSNEKVHASNMTLTPDGKVMYYTLCSDSTQDKCAIWSRKKLYEGGWEAASKLPTHINYRQSTTTQPSIGYDWKLNKFVLYFVSDRPGGKGGKDLWCSVIERDGSYGQPEPLPFNTEKDEVTPFFHLGEKTLFFSSNGLQGYGGFDIFSSKINDDGNWQNLINMGTTLNSSYDETYFSFHANVKKGYFASNRSLYPKNRIRGEYHIYEIGSVVELSIFVYNIHSTTALYGTMAHVYDETTDQKFVFLEKPFETNLKVTLWPGRDYKIVVLKDGFLPSVFEINTRAVVFPTVLEHEVRLFVDEELTHKTRETYHETYILPEDKIDGNAVEIGSHIGTFQKKTPKQQR